VRESEEREGRDIDKGKERKVGEWERERGGYR